MTGEGYVSPIQQIIDEAITDLVKQGEENLMITVKQSVGYEVDKEELIKALQYDRKQYEKGYEDGIKADGWIPVTERLPEDESYVLCWYEYFKYGDYNGLYQTYGIGFYWRDNWCGEVSCGERCRVIAWMPLPKPYKEGE